MPDASRADPPSITLVLGAVPWEVAPLEEALHGAETREAAGIRYTLGELYGMPVAISLTGVGKTNAGLVTGILCHALRPQRVLFTGSGARVRPDIGPGHVVVAQEACFHDAGNLSEDGMQPLPVMGPELPDARRAVAADPRGRRPAPGRRRHGRVPEARHAALFMLAVLRELAAPGRR